MLMEVIGFLMKEHRLIEQIIPLMIRERSKLLKGIKIDPIFINQTTDFLRTYADALHHGKEEDILFKALKKKNIKQEHARIMKVLIEEHKLSRSKVKELAGAKKTSIIKNALDVLIELYPQHIKREDEDFFYPVLNYFSKKEKDELCREAEEFDMKFPHKTYKERLKKLKQGTR